MSFSQELITTHVLLSGTKWLKPVMTTSHENQILTLITQQRCSSLCNHGFSSTPCFQLQVALLAILPLLRGGP